MATSKGNADDESTGDEYAENNVDEIVNDFMFKLLDEMCDRAVVECSDDDVDEEDGGEEFESGEHVSIGEKITLRFSEDKEYSGEEKKLTLPNGIQLSFGMIIALAGDFYGIPEAPIVQNPGEEDSHKRNRFMAAYNTLADVPSEDVEKELEELQTFIRKEKYHVEDANLNYNRKTMKRVVSRTTKGELHQMYQMPSKAYEAFKSAEKSDGKFDTMTGGKWWYFCIPLVYGRYFKLALNNQDHFLPYAKEAYLTGHQLALEKAQEAGSSSDKSLLDVAYSLDAFACHFLTDSFSSGHMRTPRVELPDATSKSFKEFGHFLSKVMHDEDNKLGLRVVNNRRDESNKWVAFGDCMLATAECSDNLSMVVEAVQSSVNQVYQAFKNPSTLPDSALMGEFIPVVDDSWSETKNHYPMFRVIDGVLHRRTDLNRLDDSSTITDWIGIGTIAMVGIGKFCQACSNAIKFP